MLAVLLSLFVVLNALHKEFNENDLRGPPQRQLAELPYYPDQYPLFVSSMNGDRDGVRSALDAGADVSAHTHDGIHAIMFAAMGGHANLISMLAGDEIPCKESYHRDPMHVQHQCVQFRTDGRGWNLLHYAVSSNDAATVAECYRFAPFMVNMENSEGVTPHQLAEQQDDPDALLAAMPNLEEQ